MSATNPASTETTVSNMALKKSALLEAIRKAPRGSEAGIPRWRYEHLRVLLNNVINCDLHHSVC